MNAASLGALRRRFSVEAPVVGADGVLAFETRFKAWGALAPQRDGLIVRLRARGDIEPGWRLRLGARLFEIVARQNDENASGFMLCECREIAP